MFRHKFCFLMAGLLLLVTAPMAHARDIYVRLAQAPAYALTAEGDMRLTDSAGRTANLGTSASLRVMDDRLSVTRVTVNGTAIGPVVFTMPVRVTSVGFLGFNGQRYRGSFLITQRGGLLNVLDIEQYLRGVVPAESSASWPMEALRAQAIISRTYALKKSLGRAERGYDVVDTVADQVYQGVGIENARTDQAVSSTANEVVAYKNELALTPFHADSGGHTASNADVWGGSQPYLVGVPEPVPYTSPVSSWSAKIPRGTIEGIVAKSGGKNIAPITEIRVSKIDSGGRAVELTFIGAKGTKTLKASSFRTAVGASRLKSTFLVPTAAKVSETVTTRPSKKQSSNTLTSEQERELAEMTAKGIFTTQELMDILSNPNQKARYYQLGLERSNAFGGKTNQAVGNQPPVNRGGFSIAKSGNDFIFYGRGWGHGVGLSQWGARALAENGWTAEMILTHYYRGTTVTSYR